MQIYKIGSEQGYEFLQPQNPAHWRIFSERFAGEPILGPWEPIRLRRITVDEGDVSLKPADIPWIAGNVLVLTVKALNVVGAMLEPHGQLLPLVCEGRKCYALNVTTVVDALDMVRSRISRFDDGRIMGVMSVALRQEMLEPVPIFKLPETPRQNLFVSNEFVETVRSHDLHGVCFHLVG